MKRKISAILLLLLAVKAKSATAFRSSLLKLRRCKNSNIPYQLFLSSNIDNDCQENVELVTTANDGLEAPFQDDNLYSGSLSNRGSSLGSLRDDLDMFKKGFSNSYHPNTNPNGYLVMLVAENKLLLPELNEKLTKIQSNSNSSLPDWVFGYGDWGGDKALKRVIAKNVMERFVGGATVDPQALRFQAGAGSILNLLSLTLGDAGDGVLVAGPTYPAFPADFELIGRMKLHVFPTDAKNRYVPTLEQLEQGYLDAKRAGSPPKIFLLCQPNNPTGVVYSREEMLMMINWALSKPDMHVVSDEIYALSVFPGIDFTSAAQIMNEKCGNGSNDRYLGDRVHIVYGLSKDWGMSGFRIGTLFSHNEQLLQAFDTLGYYQGVSQHTQNLMIQLFSDTDWIDWYTSENQRRLVENYDALEDALNSIGVTIPVPAQGSHFAWADFSCFLDDTTTEKDLWLELFREARILLTTGESCFEDKPGMFRVVHPWPRGGPKAMAELKQRLIRWKASKEKTWN